MSNDTIALTTIEAARELRCHPNTLLRWAVKEHRISYIRMNRKLLFSRDEIEKLVAGKSSK
jgi:excisionase family DNA binding protein